MINFLLSHFYDGAQVHRSKVTTFWPIFVSILNLPPYLRGKTGVGTYLLALLTIHKSNYNGEAAAEDFIYNDCFARELERLHEGIEINISPQKRFFIQARLVMHCLDSKAVEKFLKVQGAGSLAGCPLCRTKQGVFRNDLKKVVMIDHRDMLIYKHYLRQFGQSGLCCKETYFEQSSLLHDDQNKLLLPSSDTAKDLSMPNHADLSIHNRQKFLSRICNKAHSAEIVNFLLTAQSQNGTKTLRDFDWYHDENTVCKDEVYKIFGNQLYYPHCNYRPYVAYSRVSNKDYVEDGLSYLIYRKSQHGEKTHTKIVQGYEFFSRMQK
jgi:hypothetical protein